MTSMSSAASSSSAEEPRSACRRSAAAADSRGAWAATAASTAPVARTAFACTLPMKPTPMMPARIRSVMADASWVVSMRGGGCGLPVVEDLGRLLSPGQRHGQDDDRSADDLLLADVEAGQDEAVVDQADQQGAEQRAHDRPGTAEQAGPAEDHGGDGRQLVARAPLEPARL